MPPITPSHIYALSKVLPFTQSALKPRYQSSHEDEDSVSDSTSTIKTTPFLNGLSLLLVQKPINDVAAVSIVQDGVNTRVYYSKTYGFDEVEGVGVERIKALLLDTQIDHAAGFLSLAVDLCSERILARVGRLEAIGRVLGITADTPDGEFTTICVPDEEMAWRYIVSRYDNEKGLEKSSLKKALRSLLLDVPKRGTQKGVVEEYLRMATVLSEVLANGLELWSTGALAGVPLSENDGNGNGKCGVFLAKKEFGMSGVELGKVYEEAEVLMGKIVDAIGDVGAYAQAARDIGLFLSEDVDFRRSVLDRRVVFQEITPTTSVLVEITGRPIDLMNKFLRKSGRAALTDARIVKAFPEWPESRLKQAGRPISCDVHCELNLILHVIRREYRIRNLQKVDMRYGCSEDSCYLCEVYIEALRNYLVGEDLGRFLAVGEKAEVQQPKKKEEEDPDDLSTIVSHLKGFTAQPGKTLRGWFSGVTQQDGPAGKASNTPPKERPAEQQEQTPKRIPLTQVIDSAREKKEEEFENPGYSRGFRRVCAEWKFPKDTPAVIQKEAEKSIEGKLRYIYTYTRALSGKKSEDLKSAKSEDLPPTILQARSQ
ncbi:hypothetical protein TWF481_003708 [Arthrobotrys musiformis]|uniref:Uncharacterized protein n=1 Tax=Arthrobotrys musiformis TaxID=47236 RepID=A0AAV9WHU5_9PEZI